MRIEFIYKFELFASIFLLLSSFFVTIYFIFKATKKERGNLIVIAMALLGSFAFATSAYNARNAIKLKKIKSAGHLVFKKPRITNIKKHKIGKIAICMFYTKEIENFGKLTEKINRAYAKRHNYDLIVYKDRMSVRDPTWDKLKAVKQCMQIKDENNCDKYHYIMWIDADAFFNLQNIALENFINEEKKFFACEDIYQGVINAGVFIIKNDNWGKKFVSLWWKCGRNSKYCRELYHEQKIFDSMYSGDVYGIRKFAKIYEASTFNSNPGIVCPLKKGWNKTFVIHLMAHGATKRERLIRNQVKNI